MIETLTKESITLRSLKISEKLSEETLCFTATVCVHGKPSFEASNRGTGGATNIRVLPASKITLQEMEYWAKTLPPAPCDGLPNGLPMDLEFFIDQLAFETGEEQKMRKLCAKKLVYTIPSEPDRYYTLNGPYNDENKQWVLSKAPHAVFVNERFVTV